MFAPETFIVRAVDDGMEPRIRTGDYVCVDADKAPAVDGSVVLFGCGADAVVRRLDVEADGPPLRMWCSNTSTQVLKRSSLPVWPIGWNPGSVSTTRWCQRSIDRHTKRIRCADRFRKDSCA